MFSNYLLTILRQFKKNKFYFAVNIFGLASSTAVSVLILLYAYNVLTFDTFHSKADRIYAMYRDRPSPSGPLTVYDLWYPVLDETRAASADVVAGTRIIPGSNTTMQVGDKMFNEGFMWADSGFFQVFDFEFVAGNPSTALAGRNNIVLTKELKERLFGNEEAIGKTIKLFFNTDFVVSGVIGEIPPNSSIQFNAIVPLHEDVPFIKEAGWQSSFITTFIVTAPGSKPDAVLSKVQTHLQQFVAPAERGTFHLLPLTQYNDQFTSQRKYALMLLGIAFGILILAAINFTNLASAQSFGRMKEVGMRKALGATRGKLVFQFLSESISMSFVSLLIGLGLAQALLPIFSELVSMPLRLNLFEQPGILISLVVLGLLTGIGSGAYPAFFASGFQPVKVLKGLGVHHSKGGVVRTALLTFQFAIAILLISGVGIVLLQVEHMKSKDLNFEKDNVMVIRAGQGDYADATEASNKIGTLKGELLNSANVISVARSSGIPGNYSGSFSLFVAEGNEKADPFDWRVARVDADYFPTYKIKLVEGRNFIRGSETDRQTGAIINYAAMKAMGWSSAVGRKLKFPGGDGFLEIVGVTADFDYASAANEVEPVVHVYRGEENASYQFLSILIQPGSQAVMISESTKLWARINPDRSMEYFFPADRFSDLYNTEENIASIISFASGLAIVIASLGLFALASFHMAQRQKEVAVRKVMGASLTQLAGMFLFKYLLIVAAAFLISTPFIYYFGEEWLSDFAYRINISPLILLVATGICAVITIVTIMFKSLTVAAANPIKSLKYE